MDVLFEIIYKETERNEEKREAFQRGLFSSIGVVRIPSGSLLKEDEIILKSIKVYIWEI